jgi:mercuric ion binding protein
MKWIIGPAAGLTLLLSIPAAAEEQTVMLQVENLWCPSCSYIVGRTLADVPGVSEVAWLGGEDTAVITFDDQETTVAALVEATGAMGYPSAPKE